MSTECLELIWCLFWCISALKTTQNTFLNFLNFRNCKPMIRGAGFIRFSDGLDIPLVHRLHPLVCHRILHMDPFRNVNAARRGTIDDLRCWAIFFCHEWNGIPPNRTLLVRETTQREQRLFNWNQSMVVILFLRIPCPKSIQLKRDPVEWSWTLHYM